MDKLKGALQSKTVWVGFLVAIAGFLQTNTELFRAVLSEKYYGYFVSVLGVVMIALRFVTGQSLEDKASESSPG